MCEDKQQLLKVKKARSFCWKPSGAVCVEGTHLTIIQTLPQQTETCITWLACPHSNLRIKYASSQALLFDGQDNHPLITSAISSPASTDNSQQWIPGRSASMSWVTGRNSEEKWYYFIHLFILLVILFHLVSLSLVFFFIFACRLCSRLWQYHFPRWPFSLGLLPFTVQAFYMQVLQVLSGVGLLFHSSPGLWVLQWLRSVPLSQYVLSDLCQSFHNL